MFWLFVNIRWGVSSVYSYLFCFDLLWYFYVCFLYFCRFCITRTRTGYCLCPAVQRCVRPACRYRSCVAELWLVDSDEYESIVTVSREGGARKGEVGQVPPQKNIRQRQNSKAFRDESDCSRWQNCVTVYSEYLQCFYCVHCGYCVYCSDGRSVWRRSLLAAVGWFSDVAHQNHWTFKNHSLSPAVSGTAPPLHLLHSLFNSTSAPSLWVVLYVCLKFFASTCHCPLKCCVSSLCVLSGDQRWGWGAALQWPRPRHQEKKSW